MRIHWRHDFWNMEWIVEWRRIIWMHIYGAPDARLPHAVTGNRDHLKPAYFSDEAWFHLSGYITVQYFRI